MYDRIPHLKTWWFSDLRCFQRDIGVHANWSYNGGECVDMIEDFETDSDAVDDGNSSPGEELEREVVSLLQNGQKIQAVKLVRERLHCGLKESKDAVEAIERKHAIESQSGCASMLFLATGLIGAVASQLV